MRCSTSSRRGRRAATGPTQVLAGSHRAGHVGGAARGRRARGRARRAGCRRAPFDSEALWQQLRRARLARPPRAGGARRRRPRLAGRAAARSAGATVDFVAAYQRGAAAARRGRRRRCWMRRSAQPRQHLWLFSSSRGDRPTWRGCAPGPTGRALRAVATHPRIVARAQRLGFGQVRLVAAGAEALAAAVREGRPIQSIASVTEPIAPPAAELPAPPPLPARRRDAACAAAAAGSPPARCCWPRCAPRPCCTRGTRSSASRAWSSELVKRQEDSGAQAAEAQMLAKQAQDSSRDAAAKLALLEARVAEVALQRTPARGTDPVAVALARRERAGRHRGGDARGAAADRHHRQRRAAGDRAEAGRRAAGAAEPAAPGRRAPRDRAGPRARARGRRGGHRRR